MEPMTMFLCLSIFLLSLLTWKIHKKRLQLPPGPFPLPLLGNVLQGTTVLYDSYRKFYEKYGPVFTIWQGSTPLVVLCGYEALKDALINQSQEFGDRGIFALSGRLTNGYGVLNTNGERWQQLRRFSITVFRNFGMGKRSMEERIQEEARHLIQAVQDTGGKPFNPVHLLGRAVNNIINLTVFGRSWGYEDKTLLKLVNVLNNILLFIRTPLGVIYAAFFKIMRHLPGPHQKIFHDSEIVKSFIREQIQFHRDTLDSNSPRDYIDCFLIKADQEKDLHSSEFSQENLVNTVFELFLAGTETTANTMQFSLLAIITYPHIQERVQKEIDQVVGSDRLPGIADRPQMPYTNAVIHEIQRFLDLAPLALPHMVTQDTVFKGFRLLKGTTVIPLIGSALRDPAHWETPEEFNPEHFLNQNGEFYMCPAFMPFSAGKRVCLGEGLARMEIFLFFTGLLQKFTFTSANQTDTFDLRTLRRAFRKKGLVYKLRAIPRTCTLKN
ncbi:cytochrome P450, family 2, subfamily C, polypeptide 8, gene 2 L homeolog precursor [Xenopus laevis]|uniref:Cytochrome P450, family 2, subfamily C, polypeptide 8, gene 2 L homeolog precursor n=3 Tax=Xenopus laevis TaxID=8355 RepID=Q6GM73_XENLA|nr:cytochrome P450, family 2, subfamily C, polypeptide 8, gene 2 L homeolog precursor [Xenopus laevis]AAH74205.1 MGC82129 protein [Xenopus laevis]